MFMLWNKSAMQDKRKKAHISKLSFHDLNTLTLETNKQIFTWMK